mgnify:FL=1
MYKRQAEDRRIKAYEAQTKRITAILPFMPAQVVAQIADELGLDLANDPELVPGAPQVQEQMDEMVEPMPEDQEQPGQPQPQPEMEQTAPEMMPEQAEPAPEAMGPMAQPEPGMPQ